MTAQQDQEEGQQDGQEELTEGQKEYEKFQEQYRDMITEARGELLGIDPFGHFFMQVQPGMMRKRRAVDSGGGGGSASGTTPDQPQFLNLPGRAPFDMNQEIPMVNSEQEIEQKLSQGGDNKEIAALAGSSSEAGAQEQGEDEFYDPEIAAAAGLPDHQGADIQIDLPNADDIDEVD